MLFSPVKQDDTASGVPLRARKLKLQSDNCVAIAIRESDTDTAAMLIDEAAKLSRRARELTDRS